MKSGKMAAVKMMAGVAQLGAQMKDGMVRIDDLVMAHETSFTATDAAGASTANYSVLTLCCPICCRGGGSASRPCDASQGFTMQNLRKMHDGNVVQASQGRDALPPDVIGQC